MNNVDFDYSIAFDLLSNRKISNCGEKFLFHFGDGLSIASLSSLNRDVIKTLSSASEIVHARFSGYGITRVIVSLQLTN